MTIERKVGMGIAGQPSGSTDVAEVFSTHVYTGGNFTHTINNGIDLAGEGGLIWTKCRTVGHHHHLTDTERGVGYWHRSDHINGHALGGNAGITAFNSNGYNLGLYIDEVNADAPKNYVSWTFRKKKKFFDIVTWTGNNSTNRQIPHSLDGPVGMIILKCTSHATNWNVFHTSLGNTKRLMLNRVDIGVQTSQEYWNNTSPTSANFTVGGSGENNSTGRTYVAYLFADNSSEDAEEQMIKCGNVTMDGAGSASVDLGWEPQWLMFRPVTGSANNWEIHDSIRGLGVSKISRLYPNSSSVENNYATPYIASHSSGWQSNAGLQANSNYIYMAIRGPMMKEPEAATDVFALDYAGANGDGKTPNYRSTFPVDFALHVKTGNGGPQAYSRLTGPKYLYTDSTNDEGEASQSTWDFMNGWWNQNSNQSTSNGQTASLWKRAKGFMDVVAFTGSGSAKNVAHSLGVAPEMMLVKKRSGAEGWAVYHKVNGGTHFARLESTATYVANNGLWNNTDTTASVFRLGSDTEVNQSGQTYIAYLFASLAGISKVGSFTGNGTGQNIDCGFSNGAKWVLLKNASATHGWHLFDTTRGIVAGNDPYKLLNTNASQYTNLDMIDPHNSGFTVLDHGEINGNGNTIIFIAIA